LGEHHGKGAMRYNDGSIYDGQWCKSRRHGIGTFVSLAPSPQFFMNKKQFLGHNFSKQNERGFEPIH
jgi:hypothetical protein